MKIVCQIYSVQSLENFKKKIFSVHVPSYRCLSYKQFHLEKKLNNHCEAIIQSIQKETKAP